MSEIILITGAAGGIGQCLCQQLIKRDVQLILADRDAARLQTLCSSLGERAIPFAIDLTDEQQIDGLIAFIGERFGRLDVLINNAAIVRVEAFAYPNTHQQGQPLTAKTLRDMNVHDISQLHDQKALRGPAFASTDPALRTPIPIVDMIFSQPLRRV